MTNIESNAKAVYEAFEEMTFKEMDKALKSGLRKALTTVRKDAKTNIKKRLKNTSKRNPKYNDTLASGIRQTRVMVNRDGTVVGKVRIDSNKKSGSGSFRLAILESGSYKKGERFTKYYRGVKLKQPASKNTLKAYHFFKDSLPTESNFQSTMVEEVKKAVDKINNGI